MIGIIAYSDEILKFLPQIGLSRHSVKFNPPSIDGLSCIVSVGGHDVNVNHCYVQRESNKPFIQCLDPYTTRADPMNKVWILCALAKAKAIDTGNFIEPDVETITRPSLEAIAKFELDFMSHKVETKLSVDIECDIDTHEITVIGFAYAASDKVISMSVPLVAEQLPYWNESEETFVWKTFARLLSTDNPKVFQNFIFDTMILSNAGLETRGQIFDTMTAAHWIDPELPKALADLGRLYLYCDVWKNVGSWVSNESLWRYNALDAAYTLLILAVQMEKMKNDKTLDFFTAQLVPLSQAVLRVCERGWLLDANALAAFKTSLQEQISPLERDLIAFANDLIGPKISFVSRRGKPKPEVAYFKATDSTGQQFTQLAPTALEGIKKLSLLPFEVFERKVEERIFNPASPKQIKEVFEALDIKIPTRKGSESTDEISLLKLQQKHKLPFIDQLLEYRGLSKMSGTYAQASPDSDGIYRFQIVVPGTVEARFSSKQTPWETGFNSQNIPKSFRKLVIPHKPGWKIINMDFRAADPHMVAWLSGEATMQQILSSGGDLHAHTASGIYGYDITKIQGYNKDSSFERKLGKAANNGLNYGMQIPKFIETARKQGLHLTLEQATLAYNGYFKLYPGIRSWQSSIKQQVVRTRVLRTPFGRKRYFYGHLNDKLFNDALAYIAPTTVADALNCGWLIFEASKEKLRANVLGQCHDSLMLEAHEEDVDKICKHLKECYTQVTFKVGNQTCNLPTEIEVGPDWGTLSKWHS